jgi:hypothetical protein
MSCCPDPSRGDEPGADPDRDAQHLLGRDRKDIRDARLVDVGPDPARPAHRRGDHHPAPQEEPALSVKGYPVYRWRGADGACRSRHRPVSTEDLLVRPAWIAVPSAVSARAGRSLTIRWRLPYTSAAHVTTACSPDTAHLSAVAARPQLITVSSSAGRDRCAASRLIGLLRSRSLAAPSCAWHISIGHRKDPLADWFLHIAATRRN